MADDATDPATRPAEARDAGRCGRVERSSRRRRALDENATGNARAPRGRARRRDRRAAARLRRRRRAGAARRVALRPRSSARSSSAATTSRSCRRSTGCPRRRVADEGSGDTSTPGAAEGDDLRRRRGVRAASRCSRCVASTRGAHQRVVLKTDVDEHDPRAESWVSVYPGADWHERETWEMFGIAFDGHPGAASPLSPVRVRGSPAAQGLPAARARGEAVARARRRRADAG